MDKRIVTGMAVTGTTSIIAMKSTLPKDINMTTAMLSPPQSSMQENCAQSVMVDSNSVWIAEIKQT